MRRLLRMRLASETYELPHVPIINTSLLHEFLTAQNIGHFKDDAFARSALVFEPALDQSIFHPREAPGSESHRRLLFYARPTNGLRNLFELGVAALQKAIGDGLLDPACWEFVGMGEPFSPVALGRGARAAAGRVGKPRALRAPDARERHPALSDALSPSELPAARNGSQRRDLGDDDVRDQDGGTGWRSCRETSLASSRRSRASPLDSATPRAGFPTTIRCRTTSILAAAKLV